MIRIENLNKYFNKGSGNEFHALKDINLEFADSGLVTIFGHSGSGKTTLLNILGLMDKFDSGKIIIDENVFEKYNSGKFDDYRKENIGYIFQNYNLVETKTVYENVAMPLEMVGIKEKEEINKRVLYVLEQVGLKSYKKRNVTMLSGGQMQRVAIARALVKNPKIIIADEPTGNLDSNNTFEVMNIIKKISKDRLVILVSHEKNLVDFYSDRIIEIKDGEIINDRINNGGSLDHSDSRNIYLKDLDKEEVSNDSYNFELYKKGRGNKLDLDFVIKDDTIYIKNKGSQKIHLVDESSEIKFIDSSEEEFKEKIKTEEHEFNFDSSIFDDSKKTNDKRFMPLFKALGNGFFKNKRFLRRSRFSSIVFIIVAIFLALILGAYNSRFNFEDQDYMIGTNETVTVAFKNDGFFNDKNYMSLVEEKVHGMSEVKEIRPATLSRGSFYTKKFYLGSENNAQCVFQYYPVNAENYEYSVSYGRKAEVEGEIVISKFAADTYLNSTLATYNGFTKTEELIGTKVNLINNNNYEFGDYVASSKKKNLFTIVGITNENTYATPVFSSQYSKLIENIISSGKLITTVNVECTNKAAVKEALKDFDDVYLLKEEGRAHYFGQLIKNGIVFYIVLISLAVALIIFIILITRSQMFKKVKEIGVLRTVGVKRKEIINLFIGDMFATTTTKSVVAFTIANLILIYLSFRFNFSVFGLGIYSFSIISFILAIIFMYVINIGASIIPALLLTRKTPIEIMKKYDI